MTDEREQNWTSPALRPPGDRSPAGGSTSITDPQKEIEKNIFLKKDLEQELNRLKTEVIEKKTKIAQLEKALRSTEMEHFSFIENKPINGLIEKLQDLFVERGKVLRAYAETSDKVKLIDKQIEGTYALLRSEVDAYRENQIKLLETTNSKIAMIEGLIQSLNKRNVELEKQIIDLPGYEGDETPGILL